MWLRRGIRGLPPFHQHPGIGFLQDRNDLLSLNRGFPISASLIELPENVYLRPVARSGKLTVLIPGAGQLRPVESTAPRISAGCGV